MTFGRAAMASALSMSSSGVTHTGQPGPCTSSISGGSSWSRPWRTMAWVWPPQISMMTHGRVTVRCISRMAAPTSSASRYSVTYFIVASVGEKNWLRIETDNTDLERKKIIRFVRLHP